MPTLPLVPYVGSLFFPWVSLLADVFAGRGRQLSLEVGTFF